MSNAVMKANSIPETSAVGRFTAKILSSPDEHRMWTRLWLRSDRQIGCHWDFPAAAAQEVGEPIRVGILAADSQLTAGFVFVARRLHGAIQWTNPAPAPCTGIMRDTGSASEGHLAECLECLSDFLKRSVPAGELIMQPTEPDVRPLLWRGWASRPHYNYVSSIQGKDTLRSTAENSVRRQAAKAADAGYELTVGNHLLEPVLSLLGDMARRKGMPAHIHPDCYRHLVEIYGGEDAPEGTRLWVAAMSRGDSPPETGGLFLLAGERLVYLLGASRNAEGETGSGAPSLMHFQITDKVWDEIGHPFSYDWAGANAESVARFKKKFRPRLEVCQRVTKRKGILSLFGR